MLPIDNNAGRLSRTPKIKFVKGIQRSNNDNTLGFVSDLNNMEIVEGTLKRRKGSKLLNVNTVQRRWYFLEEVEISGCNLLIGLDYKRDFYAFHSNWPETEFVLCKKGIDPTYHPDVQRDFDISFRRGTNFFAFQNERYFYVTNDFGDSLRFDKKGYIAFLKKIDAAYERSLPADIEAIRGGLGGNTPAIYVDVLDVTNKKMVNFDLLPDVEKTVIPIKGPVRLAFKNEAGIISKFSPPFNVPKYKKVFASLYPGQAIVNDEIDYGYIGMTQSALDGEYKYIARTGTLSSPQIIAINTANDSRSATYDSYSWKLWYVAGDFKKYSAAIPNDFSSIITAGSYILVPVCGAATMLTAQISSFIRIKNIRGYGGASADSRRLSFGDRDAQVEYAYSAVGFAFNKLDAGDVGTAGGIDSGLHSRMWVTSFAATAQGYRVNDLKLDEARYSNRQIVQVISGAQSYYKFKGAIFDCEIDMNANQFVKYYVAAEGNVPWNPVRTMTPLGFDCWETNTAITTPLLTLNTNLSTGFDFDITTKKLTIGSGSDIQDDEIILDNTNNQIEKYWDAGSRFVVWNNDKIIAESQRLWADTSKKYKHIYNEDVRQNIATAWSGEMTYNAPNYDGTASNAVSWTKIYQPFSRLEYQNIRGYPYKIRDIQEVITNPIRVVLNNNTLFVIQEGNLWIGDSTLMLFDIIELGYTVYDMVEFYDGVLISGSKGLYYFNRNLDERFVKETDVKKMIKGQGGAFYIDKSDAVWQVDLVFGQSEVPFVRTSKISEEIKEAEWGASPQMLYADDTLWIKTEQEIWGFHDGGWTRKYKFDGREIKSIHKYDNNLVVVFERGIELSNIFDDPNLVTSWRFTDTGIIWS